MNVNDDGYIEARVVTRVEIMPLPLCVLTAKKAITCGVCDYSGYTLGTLSTHRVSPTGPDGMPLPVYYVCDKHAYELAGISKLDTLSLEDLESLLLESRGDAAKKITETIRRLRTEYRVGECELCHAQDVERNADNLCEDCANPQP